MRGQLRGAHDDDYLLLLRGELPGGLRAPSPRGSEWYRMGTSRRSGRRFPPEDGGVPGRADSGGGRGRCSPGGLFGGGARSLRGEPRCADRRRDPDGSRPHRPALLLRLGGGPARCSDRREGTRRGRIPRLGRTRGGRVHGRLPAGRPRVDLRRESLRGGRRPGGARRNPRRSGSRSGRTPLASGSSTSSGRSTRRTWLRFGGGGS